jgi:hypothetical protein
MGWAAGVKFQRGAFFSYPQRLGTNQLALQWVSGVKLPRRKAGHSPPSSTEAKNVGALSPLPHVSSWHMD